jgi:hypothetical protein
VASPVTGSNVPPGVRQHQPREPGVRRDLAEFPCVDEFLRCARFPFPSSSCSFLAEQGNQRAPGEVGAGAVCPFPPPGRRPDRDVDLPAQAARGPLSTCYRLPGIFSGMPLHALRR